MLFTPRLAKFVNFILVTCILMTGTLLMHYTLSNLFSPNTKTSVDYQEQNVPIENLHDFGDSDESNFLDKLKRQIHELWRIKGSVSNELQSMELKRNQLLIQIEQLTSQMNKSQSEIVKITGELNQLKNSIEQAQLAKKELLIENTPDLALPLVLKSSHYPIDRTAAQNREKSNQCKMNNCFDYSRCSITSTFPVYLYDSVDFDDTDYGLDNFIKTTIRQVFDYNPHITKNPKEACLYVAIVGQLVPMNSPNPSNFSNKPQIDSGFVRSLPYWSGDGRNHVLINLARNLKYSYEFSASYKAILAQSDFQTESFRTDFDLIINPVLGLPGGDVWKELSPLLPARRLYLLSFHGEVANNLKLSQIVKEAIERLQSLNTNKIDQFSIRFKCDFSNDDEMPVHLNDWFLCGTESTRKAILNKSTFVLIFGNSFDNYSFRSTAIFQTRVYEALQTGAIPVILDGFPAQLPYSETIDWRKACIFIPFARVPELHFLLRSILDSDLLEIRRQGRLIWQTYLSTLQTTIDTIVSVLRNRIGIPANPIQSFNGTSVFNSTFQPLKVPVSLPAETETEEILGPIEAPYPSPSFKRNFSSIFFQSYELWNRYFIPFRLFPQLPFDPLLPSEAKFTGSNYGFRPINKGAGGSGKEFSEALGGNYPREQLTIVILTYEREKILLSNLNRLSGLPYLNKIIIVWNSLKPPSEDLKWPDLSVPVHVIKAKVNSLNNRFLPFNIIETEAVLMMDDDVTLRHDEIVFAFRVWREHRDRIVGFPARYHAWDIHMNNSWFYNSNYSCELSMVLTGAAFVHNFYLHLYWNWFPEAIRDKVDELMNCEDIAMNFLVSHLTRKPPIKVTSRWTFRCPTCPIILSEFESHFSRRHDCINYFSKVLGYNPLLYTQYRADSVLFKTRISRSKQKCFKYV